MSGSVQSVVLVSMKMSFYSLPHTSGVVNVKVLLYLLIVPEFGIFDVPPQLLCVFVCLQVHSSKCSILCLEQAPQLAIEPWFLIWEHFNCFGLHRYLSTEVYI